MEDSNFSTTHQKITAATFLIIGMSALVLGYIKFSDSITAPFERRGDFRIKSADELEKERLDLLRAQDTDFDSLNDYDELYVFRTSPFLEDSDSDGIFDGEEVATGSDPNCPKNKTCRIAAAPAKEDPIKSLEQMIDMDKPVVSATDVPIAGQSDAAAGDSANLSEAERAITDTFGDLTKTTPAQMTAKIADMTDNELLTFLGRLGLQAEALQGKDTKVLKEILSQSMLEALVAAQQVGVEAAEQAN